MLCPRKAAIFKYGLLAILAYACMLGVVFMVVSHNGGKKTDSMLIGYTAGDAVKSTRIRRFGETTQETARRTSNGGGGDQARGRGSPIKTLTWTPSSNSSTRVAIGLAFTSKGVVSSTTEANPLGSAQFFITLLPSFCRTASASFEYHFYLAFDLTDSFFVENKESFQQNFQRLLVENCKGIVVFPTIHLVECNYTGKPAWSQNDAMMDAYLDDNDYYYRVNDDSRLESGRWTELFIGTLTKHDPPNVGVVGPAHRGGNTHILTHDFVHKTHVDIFGFYYPRSFDDLYADTWISTIYPAGNTARLRGVLLTHTQHLGKRYKSQPRVKANEVWVLTRPAKRIIARYLGYRKRATKTKTPGRKKVISMSLSGNESSHMLGAVRNAQMAPVLFPGWSLHIYTAEPSANLNSNLVTSKRIIRKLAALGARVVYVSAGTLSVSPEIWPCLAADDETVDRFVVRKPGELLSSRDFSAVQDWVKSGVSFHYMRDSASQDPGVIRDGLWGATSEGFRRNLPHATVLDFLNEVNQTSASTTDMFSQHLAPLLVGESLTHDSVSCAGRSNCRPFPDGNHGQGLLALPYAQFNAPRKRKGKNITP